MSDITDREVIEAVYKINAEIYDRTKDDYLPRLVFSTDGFSSSVEFQDTQIWCSECDERLWLDDDTMMEDITTYLWRTVKEHIEKSNAILTPKEK